MKSKIAIISVFFGLAVWAIAQSSGSQPPVTSSQPPATTSRPPITTSRPPITVPDSPNTTPATNGFGTPSNTASNYWNSNGRGGSNTSSGTAFDDRNRNSNGNLANGGTNFGGIQSGTNWMDYTNANGTVTFNTNQPHWWEKR